MHRPSIPQYDPAQRGVVLIEALIAILIFSIGILGIVGMQANMLKNTSDSKFRADAAYIAQQRIGLMWAEPDNILNYVRTDNINELPNGQVTVVQPAIGQFQVTVSWQQPGEAAHSYTTLAYIN
ncbi:MAG: prepilin-type cleavage/methylation domain-containing protein [Nitrosomonadales bacterium]|nr:prepilin-type cleavage/methylation domain-containing protein [Nitrosomonadales bacterium]